MSKALIVLPEDDIAATLKTVTGWVSRDGQFYGSDERTARWAGSTHVHCSECGAVIDKGWTLCADCREKKAIAKFKAREQREWDGKQMVYSEVLEEYFADPDEAAEAAEDNGASPEHLRLVLCEPVYAHLLGYDDFIDDLPEDGDAPDAVVKAIDAFNKALEGVVLAWQPGRVALAKQEPV